MLLARASRNAVVLPAKGNGKRPLFRLPVRVLLTSTAFPPLAAGHAVVLDRMFRGVHPDDYRIVDFAEFRSSWYLKDIWPELPAKTFHYRKEWGQFFNGYPLWMIRRSRDLVGEVADTARTLARVCNEEECKAIIVTTGSLPRLPAAIVGGRLARVPVILLIWDFWRHMEFEPYHRFVAQLLEPAVLRSAAAVVAPNEMLAESIERVSGVKSVIIRLPTDDAALQPDGRDISRRSNPSEFNIVFTGQVYPSMTEPYKSLLAALEQPGLENVTLHLYGPQPKETLENLGLRGRYITHTFVHPSQIYAIQRSADALFLALAFEGQHKNLVYTSSTSKFPDYLASGRPIIVHTPPGAFPAWYARRYDCGLVVDTPDSAALAHAVRLLVEDVALRTRLGCNARARAREEFSIETAQRRLADVLASVADAG